MNKVKKKMSIKLMKNRWAWELRCFQAISKGEKGIQRNPGSGQQKRHYHNNTIIGMITDLILTKSVWGGVVGGGGSEGGKSFQQGKQNSCAVG